MGDIPLHCCIDRGNKSCLDGPTVILCRSIRAYDRHDYFRYYKESSC